jgi:hypothetical protein
MMKEDRLYNQFRHTLADYSPTVPESAYKGMRRKLWLSQFLKFNASSFNAWYLGAALIAGLGYGTLRNDTVVAQSAKQDRIDLLMTNTAGMQAQIQCVADGAGAQHETLCKVDICKGHPANGPRPIEHAIQIPAEVLPPLEAGVVYQTNAEPNTANGTVDPQAQEIKPEEKNEIVVKQPNPKPKRKYKVDSFQK